LTIVLQSHLGQPTVETAMGSFAGGAAGEDGGAGQYGAGEFDEVAAFHTQMVNDGGVEVRHGRSPEQAGAKPVARRADIWPFGVVRWERALRARVRAFFALFADFIVY
jgi:hypothetical protein